MSWDTDRKNDKTMHYFQGFSMSAKCPLAHFRLDLSCIAFVTFPPVSYQLETRACIVFFTGARMDRST